MKTDEARNNVKNARAVLADHAGVVRERTRPTKLAGAAIDVFGRVAKKRATEAIIAAALTRKGRPVVAAGAVVGGLAYLLRKPLAKLLVHARDKETLK